MGKWRTIGGSGPTTLLLFGFFAWCGNDEHRRVCNGDFELDQGINVVDEDQKGNEDYRTD